ncbi:MAG: thioesterase family protein [Planctomycetota bacterium]
MPYVASNHDHPLSPSRPVPTSGETFLRVRYCECDPQGVAHHSAFLPWLEEGRTQLLRDAGVSYRDVEDAGLFLVVSKLELRYKAPAFYDDQLIVRTSITGGGRARLDHAYTVLREGDTVGIPLIEATSTLACVGRDGRPTALPEWLCYR